MLINKTYSGGIALVAVLWLVVLLGAIVAIVGRNSRLDTKMCYAQMQGLRTRWASRAGIETAIAALNEDDRQSDNLKELWFSNEEDFNDIRLEGCSFNVRITDEAGKLNLNTAKKKQLMALPEMTEEIADSILDWRDKDNTPRQAGAECGYYQNLRYGYKIGNGRFGTVRQLLMVKGVREELLYSRSTRWIDLLTCYSADNNKDADGQERININQADENKLVENLKIKKSQAKWIIENRSKGKQYKSIADLINDKSPKQANDDSSKTDQAEPLDLETFKKIADKITVDDRKRIPGRVNLNTADRIVLSALLDGDESAKRIADDIITYRDSLADGMKSIADVMNVKSVTVDIFKKIAGQITTRSDIYSIHNFAFADDWRRDRDGLETETVVDRNIKPAGTLYRHQEMSN